MAVLKSIKKDSALNVEMVTTKWTTCATTVMPAARLALTQPIASPVRTGIIGK